LGRKVVRNAVHNASLNTNNGNGVPTHSSQNDPGAFLADSKCVRVKIVISPDPAEASPVLEPRHQFPLGSAAFPLFQFYETTTATGRQITVIICCLPGPD